MNADAHDQFQSMYHIKRTVATYEKLEMEFRPRPHGVRQMQTSGLQTQHTGFSQFIFKKNIVQPPPFPLTSSCRLDTSYLRGCPKGKKFERAPVLRKLCQTI